MNTDFSSTFANYPDGFHENDKMRSMFIRQLILSEPIAADTSLRSSPMIPKIIIRYWHEPKAIPGDVQECLDSWNGLEGEGFEILTYNDDSAADFIKLNFGPKQAEAFIKCRHPAMRSDYFRMCYLLSLGGFYVDADEKMTLGRWQILYRDNLLKLQPLCYDIKSASMVSTRELWRTNLDTSQRIFYVNNNPLVAPPRHPVLKLALERATAILLAADGTKDIQSTTGPGNLSAALSFHARKLALANRQRDFKLLKDWELVGETKWELSYRADKRNWRNFDGGDFYSTNF